MISYLEGKIILKKESLVVLNVAGVGYEVFVSPKSLEKMPAVGQQIRVFCYLDVGERSLKLFGFKTFEELELFKLVRGISGIGPKAALEISSLGPADEIKKKIEKGDEAIFKGVPGIGAKKARKIILELSGKLKRKEPKETVVEDEAFLALLNLGFSKEQAKKALSSIPKDKDIEMQERVKQALKQLST